MTTPFRYYLRVRYQDCDAQHVVFNSRYSDYADITSIEFMRAALPRPTDGFDGTFEIQSVRQVIEWKSSARFDYVLEISAWVSRIGTTSFTLNAEMRRAGEAQVRNFASAEYPGPRAAKTWRSLCPWVPALGLTPEAGMTSVRRASRRDILHPCSQASFPISAR